MRYRLHIADMSCTGCEDALKRAIAPVPGVQNVDADYARGIVDVEADGTCRESDLASAAENASYTLTSIQDLDADKGAEGKTDSNGTSRRGTGSEAPCLLVIAVGAFVIAQALGINRLFTAVPAISGQNLGYVALFVAGLLTSVHCVAMCGGINISQSLLGDGGKPVRRSLLYNLGRLVSYTLVGGALGAIGQAVAITLQLRSGVALAAGILMLLVGISLMGGPSFAKRLVPHMPKAVMRAASSLMRHGPFAIGLVNGFMPCGPLQAMQLYAISSGGFVPGALSMSAFCLGTIPLVLATGAAARILRAGWRGVMLKASATLMVLFGLFMVQNNLSLLGVPAPDLSILSSDQQTQVSVAVPAKDGKAQDVRTELTPSSFGSIQAKAGVPVRWDIHASGGTLNGCNGQIVLQDFDRQVKLQPGDNVIEFTPKQPGTYDFSCWMGMIHGTITVTA